MKWTPAGPRKGSGTWGVGWGKDPALCPRLCQRGKCKAVTAPCSLPSGTQQLCFLLAQSPRRSPWSCPSRSFPGARAPSSPVRCEGTPSPLSCGCATLSPSLPATGSGSPAGHCGWSAWGLRMTAYTSAWQRTRSAARKPWCN